MLKFKQISASVFAIAILLVLFAGCSDKDDGGDDPISAAWLVAETVNHGTTTNKIETQGSAKLTYMAEITDQGDVDWCSFDLKNQKTEIAGEVGTPIYLYLNQNSTEMDRTAEIRVTFSDNYSTTLTMTQTAFSVAADYNKSWGEQPEYREDDAFIYKTYFAPFVANQFFTGGTLRNYSVCYDTGKHVSRWVAYPIFTKVYGTPALKRENKFGYDPNDQMPVIPQQEQQFIGDGTDNGSGYGARGYDRGHMLPQASRYNNYVANKMTYYATNMMPQNSTLNQNIWATLEGKVRGWGGLNRYDTLFVVTGAEFTTTTTINNANGPIAVPSHCWKVLLRQRGDLNKQISELTADDLKAIGFVFTNDASGAATSIKEAARSVKEIEDLTGFKFFRNLSPEAADAVKSQKDPADWGL